jgi:hypothetical protein
MQTIIGLACLALVMMWAEPASTQELRTHELTVRYHKDIELTDDKVKRILAQASEVLQRHSCNVRFTLKEPVRPFKSPDTPRDIKNKHHRDAVHREDSDVKVVSTIEFCRPDRDVGLGCAWDPSADNESQPQRRSMIVVDPDALPGRPQRRLKFNGVLWAHEFGHMTGLFHRRESKALMTACGIETDTVKIKPHECDCFRRGPGSCPHETDPPDMCGR